MVMVWRKHELKISKDVWWSCDDVLCSVFIDRFLSCGIIEYKTRWYVGGSRSTGTAHQANIEAKGYLKRNSFHLNLTPVVTSFFLLV